jgi:cytochrome c556
MTRSARGLIVGCVALALGIWLCTASVGAADDDKDAIFKVVALVKKGDMDAAKTEAAAVAKKVSDLEDVMRGFKLRKAKGWGVGPKADAIKPDGIEAQFAQGALTKGPGSKTAVKENDAFIELANRVSAVALITYNKAPEKKTGAKDPKDWQQWCEDMNKSGQDLAKALKAKDDAAVRKAAQNVNAACNNCHGVFRD